MSRVIDERVVSMQFDNKQFESNVATSMSTLEKLKQKLNLTGAVKGLDGINTAANKCNLSPISNAVETVGLKFNAMYTIADQALRNITNRVQQTAENMVKSFTIEPIKTGLAEYETQINSVQTILANTKSKGSTLDDVNGALDELNTYADKTIYNFTEMTRNIGTFTAAGVDLDKSVSSIKGIANLAAVSGSTSQQASTAMYQLSQALAAGKVQLMDWNSVVNAGMGGQVFQDALKRTATQMGYNVDELIKKYGSFRESLTQGEWLTADVLTETLTQLSGAYTEADLIAQGYTKEQAKEITELADTAVNAATKVKTVTQLMDTLKEAAQSGWTQTWEILIGDFEEAKELWTGVSDKIGEFINKTSESRNNMLEGAMTSNWDKMMTKITEAGIKTEDFEKKLKSTMKDHDVDVDAVIKKYGSLEEAFKSGSVSSDILKEAVSGLSGALVDLSSIEGTLKKGDKGEDVKKIQEALKSLEYDIGKTGVDGILGGKTEEAIKAFQEAKGLKITGIVDEATLKALDEATSKTKDLSSSCGKLIDDITKLGGRELLIESLKNIFNGLLTVVKPISRAFKEIFPPVTSEQLYKLLEGFRELTANFRLTGPQVRKVYSTFKGFFSLIDVGWTFVKELAGGVIKLLGNLGWLVDGVLNVTSAIGGWFTKLRDSVKETDIFGRAINGIASFLQKGIDKIREFGSFLSEKIKMPGFEGFLNLMKGIWNVVQKVGGKIADIGSSIGGVLSKAFSSGDISAALDIFNGGLFAGLLLTLKNFIGNFTDSAEDGFGLFGKIKDMLDGVSEILDGVRSSLETWQQNLKASILLKIAAAIGILAAAIWVISGIDPGSLAASLGAITTLFIELMGAMAIFTKLGGDAKGLIKSSISMIAISAAVLILAGALRTLSGLSWDELSVGLVGIAGLMAIVIASAKILGNGGKTVIKGATSMVIFAAAIKVLASVCRDMATMSWDELKKGLVGVGVLMAEVAVFLKVAKFSGKSISTAAGIVVLSGAIKILASACKDFGTMNIDELKKGLVSIGILLGELTIFTKLTGNAKKVVSTGLAMIAISAAMKIFASAVSDFGSMNWDTLIRGLTGMAVALGAVTIALRFMPRNALGIGVGLTVVCASLLILSEALGRMGGMSWDSIAKSLITLGVALGSLAIALNFMTGTLGGAAALLVASASLVVLSSALQKIGSMSVGEIAKSLITVAAAFAIIGIAGAVLAPLIPSILGLAGAFALIGLSVFAVGVGLAAAAAGLTALALAGTGGATAIVAALTIIVTGVAGLIPVIVQKLGEAIVVFCKVIGESATEIGNAIKAVVLALVDVLVECIPEIADGALKLITGILEALVKYTPQIVGYLFDFVVGLLDGLAERLPELIQSAVNVISQFFSGVVDALSGIDVSALFKGIVGVGLMSGLMLVLSAVAGLVPGAMIGVLGMGAVIAELAIVIAAIGALAQIPGLDWLVEEGADFIQKIGNAIGGFVGGIIGGIAEGFTASLPQIGTDLSEFMTNLKPFIDGAKTVDESAMTGVSSIADIILTLTKANLLEGLTSWLTGGSSLATFGEQLVPFGTAMKNFSAEVSGINEEAVTAAANAGMILAKMAETIPNAGGVAAFFAGENDMTTFGTQIISFGSAMKLFSNEVSGINEEAVTAAANAGLVLSEMAKAIPNAGGVAGFFAGENDMTTFGTQLVSFGSAMKIFSGEVAGINEEAVTAAANAGSIMAEMAATIPNTGGLVSWFTGDNDMATFGSQLVVFGTAMKSFSEEVSGIDSDAVTAAASAGSSLADMAKNLPESGGIWSVFTADNDMSTFAKEITKFGTGMKKFADEVAGVDEGAITSTTAAATALADLANNMPSAENITNLKTFGDNIKKFGEKLSAFADEVSDLDTSSFSTLVSDLGKLGNIDLSGLSSLSDSLSKIGTDSVNKFITSFTDASPKVLDAGKQLVESLRTGIISTSNAIPAAIKTIITKAFVSAKTGYSNFYDAGKYLVQGFASGITINTFRAQASAKAMAQKAYESAKKALDINSPSKLFRSLGTSVPEGFALGIDKLSGMVEKSSVGMADAAFDSTKNAIYRIADIINSDIDAQPTIRPVVDLSGVASGAGAINGMFNMNPSVGVMTKLGSISTSMASRQNGTNSDVISAINDLGKKLGKSSGDNFNINGITYDDGTNVSEAVRTLVRAVRVERRT